MKNARHNIKVKKETHEALNRYARKLAVEKDMRVTLDEAIMTALAYAEGKARSKER